MSKKTNPTYIGIFVLGAILIAAGAVMFFGTTKLFTRTKTYVCFFEQSVAGIQVGSAVKFKGVPVGQVTKIQMRFDEDKPTYVKVVFDLNADLIVNSLGANVDLFNENFNRKQVKRGLRASLSYESFITGQLYLELDYHADAPPPIYLQTQAQYTEIPTLPSNIEAIVEEAQKAIGNLGKIDFQGLSRDLEDVLTSTRKSIADIKFDELSASVRRTADSISGLASSPELNDALVSLKGAFDHLSSTLQTLQGQIDPVANALQPDLVELRKTLVELQKTSGSVNSTLAPDGDLRYQLSGTLSQLNNMAKALEQLSEFLERNPNSLIFGRKPAPGTKQ
jgi:paraquat-inducible protein B